MEGLGIVGGEPEASKGAGKHLGRPCRMFWGGPEVVKSFGK